MHVMSPRNGFGYCEDHEDMQVSQSRLPHIALLLAAFGDLQIPVRVYEWTEG